MGYASTKIAVPAHHDAQELQGQLAELRLELAANESALQAANGAAAADIVALQDEVEEMQEEARRAWAAAEATEQQLQAAAKVSPPLPCRGLAAAAAWCVHPGTGMAVTVPAQPRAPVRLASNVRYPPPSHTHTKSSWLVPPRH